MLVGDAADWLAQFQSLEQRIGRVALARGAVPVELQIMQGQRVQLTVDARHGDLFGDGALGQQGGIGRERSDTEGGDAKAAQHGEHGCCHPARVAARRRLGALQQGQGGGGQVQDRGSWLRALL